MKAQAPDRYWDSESGRWVWPDDPEWRPCPQVSREVPPMSDYTPRLAAPVRPYPPDAPLVAVHEAAWEEAQEAEARVLELQDALANANAYAERLPERIADYLLSYSGGGSTSDPEGWQAGHNYAMREAARMVREHWFELGAPSLTLPPSGGVGES